MTERLLYHRSPQLMAKNISVTLAIRAGQRLPLNLLAALSLPCFPPLPVSSFQWTVHYSHVKDLHIPLLSECPNTPISCIIECCILLRFGLDFRVESLWARKLIIHSMWWAFINTRLRRGKTATKFWTAHKILIVIRNSNF